MASLETARNKPGYRQSQATRERIRDFLAARPSTLPPPSAELVRERLGLLESVRTVRWHMQQIRLEYAEQEDDEDKAA